MTGSATHNSNNVDGVLPDIVPYNWYYDEDVDRVPVVEVFSC